MRIVLKRPVRRSPRGTPGWVNEESPVFSRSSLMTSIIRGVVMSSERMATICTESGDRLHASGQRSDRASFLSDQRKNLVDERVGGSDPPGERIVRERFTQDSDAATNSIIVSAEAWARVVGCPAFMHARVRNGARLVGNEVSVIEDLEAV